MTPITKGLRCLACPGGPWAEVTIVRCNEDGTFNVVPVGSDSFLDEWQGVTRPELSIDDEAQWPALFERLRGGRAGLGRDQLWRALDAIGLVLTADQMATYWAAQCGALLDRTDDLDRVVLDLAQAYRLIRASGYCANMLAAPPAAGELFRLYWNEIRMGGRDPADVERPIGLADTLAVLGLSAAGDDLDGQQALAGFELAHGLRLPATLRGLWTRIGALDAICGSHCNNPEPCPVGAWTLRRDVDRALGGELAARIMTPHQGEHAWWAVFADGADDAAIAISFADDGPPLRRVAASLAFFFWDLAETGRCWYLAEADDGGDDGDDDDQERLRG